MTFIDYILTVVGTEQVLLHNPLKWVHNVVKNDPKNLATLKLCGKNFGDMLFSILMYFDKLNLNLKSVHPRKFLFKRYQSCHSHVCLSTTVGSE